MNLQDVLEQVVAPGLNFIAAATASSTMSTSVQESISLESRLMEVRAGGRIFQLAQPIEISARWESGAWSYESSALSILAFGDTPQAASRSFQDDFAAMWDVVGQSPSDLLTPQANRVKTVLQRLVKSAEPE
jgi:hypothetical protein